MKNGSLINSLLVRYNKINDYRNFIFRTVKDLPRYQQRKRYARKFLNSPPGPVFIEPRKGYVLTSADRIEGLAVLLPMLKGFAERKLAGLDVPRLLKQGTPTGRSIKPFYFNILTRSDLLTMPQLVDFAVNESMLQILVPYYGLLPELSCMALFVSGFTEPFTEDSKPQGTQCFHCDNHDLRHVKFFYFLHDVDEKDGPLTLLPADKTAWLLRRTGRRWRTSPFRVDEEVFRFFGNDDFVRITGPAGTVAIVDTTKCLHFGSRCQSNGHRAAFVIHYTLFADYSSHYSADFEDLNMATSPEFHDRVAGDPCKALVYRLLENSGPCRNAD